MGDKKFNEMKVKNMVNNLKMSIFALGMSLSMGVVAASTMDSTTGSEDNLNRPNSSGTPNIQDCSIRNGSDRLLCEKEAQNDATRSLPNDNARFNRNNGSNRIDERKSRDLQSKEMELNNSQRYDLQPYDSDSRNTKPRNSNPSSSGSDGSSTGALNAM